MNYHVVIPAAGAGRRMGAGKNKLFLELKGKPLIIYTLEIFEKDEWCQSIILVCNENDREEMESLIKKYTITKVSALVTGGPERQHSVYKGLSVIEHDPVVLIHDGARPFVKTAVIRKLVEKTNKYGAATVAVPVKDTIKRVRNHTVSETLERSQLWTVQTPQAFRLSLIKQAHERAVADSFVGTDDASLVERLGQDVLIVTGDYENIKITTPEDLVFAGAIIEKKQKLRG